MHDVKRSPFLLADCSMIIHVPVSDSRWRNRVNIRRHGRWRDADDQRRRLACV
jgi:hypothetical protein